MTNYLRFMFANPLSPKRKLLKCGSSELGTWTIYCLKLKLRPRIDDLTCYLFLNVPYRLSMREWSPMRTFKTCISLLYPRVAEKRVWPRIDMFVYMFFSNYISSLKWNFKYNRNNYYKDDFYENITCKTKMNSFLFKNCYSIF